MDKKLKIAIIGSRGYPYVYSGYETLVKELSERLVKKGHNVRVYCHRPLFKMKPKNINGIELVYTPSIETKYLSQFVNSFFSFIHVCFSKIDVVLIVNSANGPFGILTKLFGKKTCINVDGLEWLRPKWKGFGSLYFKISSKMATVLFDEIITDSLEMKKVYQNKFKRSTKVIAYGSTMLKYNFDNDYLNFLNIEKDDYFLIVGRLIPDNNSYLITKGFINSRSKKKLVIVGDVPYKDSYSKSVKLLENEKIILTGYIKSQKKLSLLYKNCYCYIHGHEFGGTNPTMINALDLNSNIISLETKFNREMLTNKKAIFFDKNANSIKDAIIKFEKQKNVIIKDNSNYIFPKKYKWQYITNQYLELFYGLTNFRNK